MQQQPVAAPYPISDFLEWHVSSQLEIQPKFQRRDVWALKAKSYLVDTILRALPIPPIFVRLTIDPIKRRSVREVVDGQQRLRSVFGFMQNEFPILSVHNTEYADMYYADLPSEIQKHFLGYKFNVNVLENITDAEVLGIFARMNTYTVKLKAQELRNAEFFGAFKQAVYKLSLQYYTFWRNNIFTDMQIARMDEAELVSELFVSMLDGIRQTKAADLREFYDNYDDEFPQAERIYNQFEFVINTIGDIFGETLPSSEFSRIPMFYTLFLAIYDGKFGLPKSDKPRIQFTAKQNKKLAEGFRKLNGIIISDDPPQRYVPFINAGKLSTADIGKRRLRHNFLWTNVFSKVINAEKK
jgi:hypothetical protein